MQNKFKKGDILRLSENTKVEHMTLPTKKARRKLYAKVARKDYKFTAQQNSNGKTYVALGRYWFETKFVKKRNDLKDIVKKLKKERSE